MYLQQQHNCGHIWRTTGTENDQKTAQHAGMTVLVLTGVIWRVREL